MPKNYNLQTSCKKFKAASSHVVFGSSVAAGMTRYVTMVRVHQDGSVASGGSKVYFCSTAASNSASNATKASSFAKLTVAIKSGAASVTLHKKHIQIPAAPNSETPLFTIAASKWFTATLASAAGAGSNVAEVVTQWYDQ